MHTDEVIRLLEWEDKRNSREIRRISGECRMLNDRIAELTHEVSRLKEMIERLSSPPSVHTGADSIDEIEEDIVF